MEHVSAELPLRSFRLVALIGFFTLSAYKANSQITGLNCDLSEYRVQPGLTAEVLDGILSVRW